MSVIEYEIGILGLEFASAFNKAVAEKRPTEEVTDKYIHDMMSLLHTFGARIPCAHGRYEAHGGCNCTFSAEWRDNKKGIWYHTPESPRKGYIWYRDDLLVGNDDRMWEDCKHEPCCEGGWVIGETNEPR